MRAAQSASVAQVGSFEFVYIATWQHSAILFVCLLGGNEVRWLYSSWQVMPELILRLRTAQSASVAIVSRF